MYQYDDTKIDLFFSKNQGLSKNYCKLQERIPDSKYLLFVEVMIENSCEI